MRTKIELINEDMGLVATSKGRWWTVLLNDKVLAANVSAKEGTHIYFETFKTLKNK